MAKCDFADLLGQYKFDLAGRDFLVQSHGREEASTLAGSQFHLGGQSGSFEQAANSFHLGWFQTEDLARNPGGGELADSDGFSMQVLAVA